MSRYDFGERIVPGSTMEWAFKKIFEGAEVLELGPAVGTLTKHLCEDKKCKVDIIEIDEEAGKKAASYARTSFIGTRKGDIEKYFWYEELKNNRYDFIVILDVLEHLKGAENVLGNIRELLKEDGVILLSVPNIAHNSIIINLFNNIFQYTEVGLLDSTHVHFYTRDSLHELLKKVNLFPVMEEAIQLRVGENEIHNTYKDVPCAVEAFLRTRENADVYQFLFSIKKNFEEKEKPLNVESLPYTLYRAEVLDDKNQIIKTKNFNPQNKLKLEFATEYPKEELRLNPLNGYCVLQDLSIIGYTAEETVMLDVIKTNAAYINDKFIFMNDDPQIFFAKKEGVKKICIEASVLSYGIDDLKYAYDLWEGYLIQKAAKED